MTLLAGGFDPDGMSREDAHDLAGMMVMMGKAVPAGQWVESFVERARAERARSLPHCQT